MLINHIILYTFLASSYTHHLCRAMFYNFNIGSRTHFMHQENSLVGPSAGFNVYNAYSNKCFSAKILLAFQKTKII